MKKLALFFVIMSVAFAGTAMAQNSVELSTATSGVSTVFWGPSYSDVGTTNGASAYVLTGPIATSATKLDTGTTLYAISNTATNTAGTELRAVALQHVSGATPIGGAQLISGTSDTVIVYVHAASNEGVGSSNPALFGTLTGTTLYAIRGLNGTVYWSRGFYEFSAGGAGTASGTGLYNASQSGATFYSLAPVTIDNENLSRGVAAARAGATIFGVVGGVSAAPVPGATGISVFAISAQTGNYTTNASGKSAVTSIFAPVVGSAFVNSGVSAVHAAPVVSGTSLFILGFGSTINGTTLYQLAKNNIYNGFTAAVPVRVNNGELGDQFTPTPAVSGGSIFVVGTRGGVTAYRTDSLARLYTTDYTERATASGVSAAPVTNGTYIVLCSAGGVTAYKLNNLSGNSKEWTFDFGNKARFQINSTPAISNGFVWLTVNDLVLNSATTYRFTLSNRYDGDPRIVVNHGKLVFASPIIVGGNLWTATFDPVVTKTTADGARGNNYWTQFKADAAKTGNNTAAADEDPAVVEDDDSGCFISTIK